MLTLGCNSRLFSLLNRSSLHLNLRAFSSSSSDCTNQSRGGLPRFFSETLPPSKAHSGGVVRVEGDEFWHMTRVLRLGINDRVELFNGKGGLVGGRIENIDRAGVDFMALENPKLISPKTTQWHIFAAFSTLKGGRADWLVEKCTELGASSVTPLLTERSQSISENRVDRLQRVILAAAKQSQRLHEMILKPPIVVGELLTVVALSRLSFVAAAEATPVFNTLSSLQKEPSGVIIIGPEGDFTEEELNSIMEAGAIAVGLGPLRLRVETATLALLSALMLCVVLFLWYPAFWRDLHCMRPKWPSPEYRQLLIKSKCKQKYLNWGRLLVVFQMAIQLENLVASIKSKVRSLKKSKKPYVKMDKSASVKVEIRSRKARKLIDKTLKAADRPGKKQIP
ncbi:Ribosomal RNA small subunit methyltransferase E [Sesamum angolense]|uniref:16S rRNA (uracil(1498)-N(3))-methyltransferase n=1 Tax=Sesamum angolense TaxID=2727404 RepID=A0AAE1WYH4_9LAMI|nr:Ribosomal RNA small subunit methyltransferase E [Sesamum angolense]